MINGLMPYPEYQPSRLKWMGEIPSHWEEKRAKYYFREVDERSATGDEELLSVSHVTGVTPRTQKNVTMFKAESYIGHKVCQPGDLVINTMWAWMAAMGIAEQAGITSPSYGVYRPLRLSDYVPEYVDHLLRTKAYASEYFCRSTGIRSSRLRLYPDDFLDIPIVCPPRDEQKAILAYLKTKILEIHRFIRNKERLIELLREQKQAIISHAVTRGIDPDVRLKPSGIDWLGDVPEHWVMIRLGSQLTLVNGYPFDSRRFSQTSGMPLVRIRDILSETTEVQYDGPDVPEALIDTGDVVVGMDGDFNVAIWHGGPALLNQRVCCLRPRNAIIREYLSYFLAIPLKWINDQTFSTTVKHLSSTDIRRLRVFLPGPEEQRAIIDVIREQTREIDRAISHTRRQIDLIREYRTRLIADVVTGKVDVRSIPVEDVPEDEALEEFVESREIEEALDIGGIQDAKQ